jgi:hypothetical protein
VYPSVSLRPLITSKPEGDEGDEVGEEDGDVDGEIAVLSFVVKLRRRGIVVVVVVISSRYVVS